MHRPFVAVVLSYAAGLLLAMVVHVPLAMLFTGAITLLLLAGVLKKFRTHLIWPLLLLTGWINLSLRTDIIAPNDLRTSTGSEPALVRLRGRLAETPRLHVTALEDRTVWRSVVPVQALEIQAGGKNFPVQGEVMVNTPGVLGTEYFAGQPVEISGVLAEPSGPEAEGRFDYKKYLAGRGIYRELQTESTNDWKLLNPHQTTPPLTDRFLNWSKKTLAIGLPEEDQPLQLLWAMTLGWRTALTPEISDSFLRAGTMHLFAIDGLRIALMAGIIVAFLRALRLSRGWSGAIVAPLIWFYTAATGWEPPAVRASVMMTIVLGGWAIKRPGDLLNSLALAAFIILVQEPRQLFEAGFQLSFFVVLVIGLMLPPLNAFIDRVVRHDPLLPESLVPGWQGLSLKWTRWIARLTALSFAAWVGSLPLSAEYFHLFSPVSTLANVFAVPCGALALTANLASLICGAWLPVVSGLFNQAAWFFMVAMTWISELATKIPDSFLYVPAPPMALIIIYYTALIALLGGWFSTRWRKLLGVTCLAGLIVAGFGWWQFSRDETRLTVLPLNGGQSIYVDAAGRKNDWLIDCGSTAAVDFTLKSFLRAQGVNRIPHLVLSEGDAKNSGGAGTLSTLFPVDELWTSDIKFRSAAYRATLTNFDKLTIQHQIAGLGQNLGNWKVLHPDPATPAPRADDNALALLGTLSDTRVLLLSDLSRDGQDTLLAGTNDLHADIVIAGLPEKGEPLCDPLLAAIHPKLMVVVDSEKPVSRRARPELKSRLGQSGIPVVYTRESGAATILITSDGWAVRTMTSQWSNIAKH